MDHLNSTILCPALSLSFPPVHRSVPDIHWQIGLAAQCCRPCCVYRLTSGRTCLFYYCLFTKNGATVSTPSLLPSFPFHIQVQLLSLCNVQLTSLCLWIKRNVHESFGDLAIDSPPGKLHQCHSTPCTTVRNCLPHELDRNSIYFAQVKGL